jgi:hypothetical protein
LLAVALIAPTWGQPEGRGQGAQKPPFPTVSLPEHARGQRAIELLGARLPEVAAWYGKLSR